MQYTLVDCGDGQKLEQFGPYLLIRPCPQAVWPCSAPESVWEAADATFSRHSHNNHRWTYQKDLPKEWVGSLEGIQFKLKCTDFGHVGVFPEHASQWKWMETQLRTRPSPKVLNLFAYSGGATLAAALAGAEVCHLDAAKGMVSWARENAALNQLEKAPIRWIVDDVRKFLAREERRGVKYDAIILDPPTFGRGNAGEVFKIEEDLPYLLEQCRTLLSDNPLFVLFSCHTPGYTPLALKQVMGHVFEGKVEAEEMIIASSGCRWKIPSGTVGRWTP